MRICDVTLFLFLSGEFVSCKNVSWITMYLYLCISIINMYCICKYVQNISIFTKQLVINSLSCLLTITFVNLPVLFTPQVSIWFVYLYLFYTAVLARWMCHLQKGRYKVLCKVDVAKHLFQLPVRDLDSQIREDKPNLTLQ